MNGHLSEYEQWLIKAEHDIKSARVLINADDPVLDTAVYHCQQAAEKSFKAMLAYWNEPVLRTHDINALVEQCIEHEKSIEQWRDAAEELTPYGTFFRYPGDVMEPETCDARNALRLANEIYSFVTDYLEV